MVTADTKEVEATGKVSYKSETVPCAAFGTAGDQWLKEADRELTRILEEQEIEEELRRQAEEQAERERKEAEEQAAEEAKREAEEAAAEEAQRAAEEAAGEDEGQSTDGEMAGGEEQGAVSEAVQPMENSGWIYTVSEADYAALLKIVEAEASGEDITGRMLVANVVLNRVKSPKFPDTIEGVVYQKKGGKAQFSPVSTGKIERVRVSEETVEAVERALCGEDPSAGALYFVAPAYANPESLQWFRNSLTKLFDYHGHEFYS